MRETKRKTREKKLVQTVKNSTKTERELVLEKGSTISTKRTGLCKTPKRGREKRRERDSEDERERKMMTTANILCEKISTKRLRGLRLALNQFGST